MDSTCLILLLIFSSNSRGDGFLEISSLGTVSDDDQEYFEEGKRSVYFSAGLLNAQTDDRTVGESSQMATESDVLSEGGPTGEEDISSTRLEGFKDYGEAMPLPELKKVLSVGTYPTITYDPYKNIQTNGTIQDQIPKRRDLNNWKSDAMFEPNDYNTKDMSRDYYEETPYSSEKRPGEVGADHPQYYQKNYYYNYYPLVNGRRFIAPNVLENYVAEAGNRKPETTGPSRLKKINPCRQYLEFLRYAFQKLERNADYEYDYNEYGDDWRDADLYRNQNLFGTRMIGPTLYIDNSGRAYQLNNKEGGVPPGEKIYPVSKDPLAIKEGVQTNPTTLSETYGTSEMEIHTSISSPSVSTSNWNRTGYSPTRISTEESPSGKYKTKTMYPTSELELTNEIKDYQKMFTSSKTPTYQTTQTTPYTFEETPEQSERTFDDSDLYLLTSNPPTTTMSPALFNPEDYSSILANMKENPEPSFDSINSSLFYWFSRSSKFEKTATMSPILPATTGNGFSAKTLMSFDTSARGEKKEEDCNDRMLPCPDTINITYPLNGYCNRYVSCESGRAIRKTCPDGLHFNIIIKGCDIPHNSFCTYSCPDSNGYYGIPGDCSGYFVCRNFMPEYRMCPPRMHWDTRRNICTFAELSQCPMKCLKANEVKHYEGDCKAYIVCLNYFPYYHKCPPNTKFDSSSLSCVPERLSTCEDDPSLLTKTLNPTLLCNDVEVKVGTRSWCRFFMS